MSLGNVALKLLGCLTLRLGSSWGPGLQHPYKFPNLASREGAYLNLHADLTSDLEPGVVA
jgi:hypothetical protein